MRGDQDKPSPQLEWNVDGKEGRRRAPGGQARGPSTASVYFFFRKQLRDSGLPADALVGKLKKDISFALRRGTMAQVTTPLTAAQRAVVRRG